jgi:hypothetical protein
MCLRCFANPVVSSRIRSKRFCDCDDPDPEAGGGVPCCKICGKVVDPADKEEATETGGGGR